MDAIVDYAPIPGCPTAAEFAHQTGTRAPVNERPDVDVRLVDRGADAVGMRFVGVLTVSGEAPRWTEAASCRELADALALVLLIRRRTPLPTHPGVDRLGWLALRGSAGALIGGLPELAPTGALAVLFGGGTTPVRVHVEGSVAHVTTGAVAGTFSPTVEASMYLARVGACYRVSIVGKLGGGGCLSGTLGALDGRAYGFVGAKGGRALLFAAEPGLFANAALTPVFGVEVGVSAPVWITRPRFQFATDPAFFRLPALSIVPSIAVTANF